METRTTILSDHIKAAMEDKGMSIKDLALSLGITYEHARRISSGLTLPSKFILRECCRILDPDQHEMMKLMTADSIRIKYGSIPIELSGKDPSLEPLERVWGKLTDAQKETLISTAKHFANLNRN